MVTNGRDLVMIQGDVAKIIKKYIKKLSLVKQNAARSGNNTALAIAAINWTKYGHSCSLSVDSDWLLASLELGDPTKMAATRDYFPARHEASTYIMSMGDPPST